MNNTEEALSATNMTAILNVELEDGFLLSADSLALSHDDRQVIDGVNDTFAKIFPITKTAMIGVASTDFPISRWEMYAAALYQMLELAQVTELSVIMEQSLKLLPVTIKGFPNVEFGIIFTGYAHYGSNKLKKFTRFVDKSYKPEPVKGFYASSGIQDAIKEAADAVKTGGGLNAPSTLDQARRVTKVIFDHCRKVEEHTMETNKPYVGNVHIGGKVTQYKITTQGYDELDSNLSYPSLVKCGDIFRRV